MKYVLAVWFANSAKGLYGPFDTENEAQNFTAPVMVPTVMRATFPLFSPLAEAA